MATGPVSVRPLQSTQAHAFAFGGLQLFTVLLYLRPNELLPIGGFPIVKIVGLVTLLAFLLERLSDGRRLSVLPRPAKYLLGLGTLAILSIPVAADPAASFSAFTDVFLKVLLVFLLMINVVTSFRRLRLAMEVMVLSGAFVAVATLFDFARGRHLAEGFRAAGAVGGIFGNPNDLALAMNVLIPLAAGLAISRSNPFLKLLYLGSVGLFAVTVVVTYSRSGFSTLAITGLFLLAKLGRRYPVAWAVGAAGGMALFMASPGAFWNRILTIFNASGGNATAAESATARWGLIQRSLEVAGFNPVRWLLGVGLSNFHIVSDHELVNHNAYLQVFNEVGLPALLMYLLFLASVMTITARITKRYLRARGYRQIWLAAATIQASLVAYAVGSFFASVAFLWYVYYPAAFAVCLQRFVARTEREPEAREAAPRVWYLRRLQH